MRGIFKGTILFLGGTLVLYVLPKLIENFLIGHFNPWLGCVLWGDLIGCFVLYRFFGMRLLAVLLYLSLAEIDAILLATHIVSPAQLAWVTDLVPTMAVGAVYLLSQMYVAERQEDSAVLAR